jgi:transposase
MPKTRREFSPEFKREAVALLEGSGRPLMQVAREVGISPSMLRTWRAVVRGGTVRSGGTVSPLPTPADQASEITRLRRELDRTRMERDVLKKAIGIFAEVPR